MTTTAESEKAIETYLASLRRHLRDLMDEDVRDIVEEIHAHILDKTSANATPETIAATLASLGSPQQLAVRYHTEELVQRAQLSRSPALVMRTILRWATLSLGGMLVFMLSGIGYCIGGMLFGMALLKAFFPRQEHLNIQYEPGHTWSAGFGSGATPGHDPIGLWLIPICLVLGGGILFLTFRFGTWSLRLFSRPRHAVVGGAAEDLT
jgi:hypothetical protein